MLFQRATIIGIGLIGSSLARAMREYKLVEHITALDQSEEACQCALDLGIADVATTDVSAAIQDSDLVIIAVPVGAFGAVAASIAPHLKSGAIISDVGSVKQTVIDAVQPHLSDDVHFIPAHPIAGTENSGPQAGFAHLFDERWSIITPLPDADIKAVELITKLWEGCGARIEIMTPERHDMVLGITSHLPHLIAYTIIDTATDLEGHMQDEVIKFSAGGFRDFTRIAASNPVMWRDIFLNNKDAVLDVLQRFNEDLTALQKAIRRGNGDYLEEVFTRTRDMRSKVIECGQANRKQQATHQKDQG